MPCVVGVSLQSLARVDTTDLLIESNGRALVDNIWDYGGWFEAVNFSWLRRNGPCLGIDD